MEEEEPVIVFRMFFPTSDLVRAMCYPILDFDFLFLDVESIILCTPLFPMAVNFPILSMNICEHASIRNWFCKNLLTYHEKELTEKIGDSINGDDVCSITFGTIILNYFFENGHGHKEVFQLFKLWNS